MNPAGSVLLSVGAQVAVFHEPNRPWRTTTRPCESRAKRPSVCRALAAVAGSSDARAAEAEGEDVGVAEAEVLTHVVATALTSARAARMCPARLRRQFGADRSTPDHPPIMKPQVEGRRRNAPHGCTCSSVRGMSRSPRNSSTASVQPAKKP